MTTANTNPNPTKLDGGAIYGHFKHIQKYLDEGKLPNIHKQMGIAMEQVPKDKRGGAIDFGACHGMLSIRARKMGWGPVIGLEMNQKAVDAYNQFVRTDGVTLQTAKLDVRTEEFAVMCRDWVSQGINTFLCRRVLSELFATTFGKAAVHMETGRDIWLPAGHAFGKAAADAGIEYIVLEGRLYGPYRNRLAHPIYNTDIEIEAIGPLWKETFRSKKSEDAAVILERA